MRRHAFRPTLHPLETRLVLSGKTLPWWEQFIPGASLFDKNNPIQTNLFPIFNKSKTNPAPPAHHAHVAHAAKASAHPYHAASLATKHHG